MTIHLPEIYTFCMSSTTRLLVQMKGPDKPAILKADTVEYEDQWLLVKRGEKLIGQFERQSVIGWWQEDKPVS